MATSNNGHNEQTAIAEAFAATNSEPVQATDVPLSPQQRGERCLKEINVILAKYNCTLEGSWEEIPEHVVVKRIKSRQVEVSSK